MATNASASLITAIEASLADATAEWTVLSVLDSSRARMSAVYSNGNAYNTTNVHTLLVEMQSVKVRSPSGAPFRFSYRSIKSNSSFDEAYIVIDGCEFMSTDTSLESTMRAKAAAFVAAADAAALAALNAGPQASGGPIPMPSPLLAALIASLEDEDMAWQAKARVETTGPETTTITVNLLSLVARLTTGSRVPAQFNWIGTYSLLGQLVEARVFLDGCEWRTTDATLEGLVTDLADAYLAARAVSLAAALQG